MGRADWLWGTAVFSYVEEKTSRSEWLDDAEGATTSFTIASGGVLSEGYGHGRPGVCLGDGQTETEGVLLQGGCGDALLWRIPPYVT